MTLSASPASVSDEHNAQEEVCAGLLATQAAIPPKFFYDALGSKLFEAICELPEYYPTRTEAGIFATHGAEMAAAVGAGATLIDLGAGNCAKAAGLFPVLRPAQYVAVDISTDFLEGAVAQLRRSFTDLDILCLAQDFSRCIALPAEVKPQRRVFFYPGSSIGNFTPEEAGTFLQRLRASSPGCRLLIGVDLVKEQTVLEAAYDDALGVTAAFNLNVLLHANRLAGTDFSLADWRHRAFFNRQDSRIEMHLEARRDLTVKWGGGQVGVSGTRRFAEGESIHTENSYKYTPASILALLEQAGFHTPRTWTDARGWFMVCHAQSD